MQVNKKDRIGQRFGRWTVIAEARPNTRYETMWLCECDCGSRKRVLLKSLQTGMSQSCGCLQAEIAARRLSTHGESKLNGRGSHEHQIWRGIITRTENPNSTSFQWYGARGITICERWRRSFPNFLADMGRRPTPEHSLDRKDSKGNYEPANCRWATRSEQNRNRANTVWVTAYGLRLPVSGWESATGVTTLSYRLSRGWSPERAVGLPFPEFLG